MADGADPDALLRDWMTVVQTELAGLAADREARETWQALGAMLAGVWAPGPVGHDPAGHDPAGAAAAAAASVAGGDAPRGGGRWDAAGVAALFERIDALERRVAELERGGAG